MDKTRGSWNENSKKRSLNNPDEEENHDNVLGSTSKRSASPSGTNPKPSGSSDQPFVTYDPKKRDPQYANAEYAGLWELVCLFYLWCRPF